jgi:ankyrin repeat protein
VPLLSTIIEEGKFETVQAMIDRKASVTVACSDGFTPLMHAATNGDIRIVQAVLGADPAPDVNAENYYYDTAIFFAAMAGSAEVTQTLLSRGAKAHVVDCRGDTPLLCSSSTECSALLLQAGACADDKTSKGLPLLVKTCQGRQGSSTTKMSHEEALARARVLLDAGATVDAADGDGNTALMEAAVAGNAALVQLLLERGASVGRANNAGATALMLAAEARCCRLLLAAGARPGDADAHGVNALMSRLKVAEDSADGASSAAVMENESGETACVEALIEHVSRT